MRCAGGSSISSPRASPIRSGSTCSATPIESIRVFDTASQRSGKKRDVVSLRPVSEVPLDKDSIARFRTGWRELFGPDAAKDPIYLSISDGRRHPGMEHWVPLFHTTMENLLDYLPDASVSLDHQANEVLDARLEMIADHYQARKVLPRDGEVPYRPMPPDRLYLDRDGWDEMLSFGPLMAFTPFARPDGAGGVDGGGRSGPVFAQSGAPIAGGTGGGPGIVTAAVRGLPCSTSCAPRPNGGPRKDGASSLPAGPAAPASG